MTKEITDLEEQLSNLSDHDLYALIATLTKWEKRIKETLDKAKDEYKRQRNSGDSDELRYCSCDAKHGETWQSTLPQA